MKRKKKTLIITDDSTTMQNLGEKITAIMKGQQFAEYSVVIIKGKDFSATDLLPVQSFFIGCETPKAFSSLYIEDLFAHINLAGRSCGIISNRAGAIKYLSALVRASEATVGKLLLAKDGTVDNMELQNWIHSIIQQGGKNE